MRQQCCGDAQQMHRGQYGSRESSTHCNLRSYANKTQADEEDLPITNTTQQITVKNWVFLEDIVMLNAACCYGL